MLCSVKSDVTRVNDGLGWRWGVAIMVCFKLYPPCTMACALSSLPHTAVAFCYDVNAGYNLTSSPLIQGFKSLFIYNKREGTICLEYVI